MKKKAEFGFVWFFAIFAGSVILVLAIYGATKIGDTKSYQTNTEIARQFSILTDPLQAGFAEGSFGKIIFNQEIKLENYCYKDYFGRNEISINTKLNNKWSPIMGTASITNKYIFSQMENQGNEFYIFSKPFNFPYKIADMIILTTENYCFINPPDAISSEISGLNMQNIKIQNCSKNDIKVCFSSGNNCDIMVYSSCTQNCDSDFEEGTVEKNGETLKFVGNLIYPAIFSDKEIYDCNVQRLLFRDASIAEIFEDKTDLMNARDCGTNLKPDLLVWQNLVGNSTSEDIIYLNSISKDLDAKNRGELCGMW